MWFGHAGHRTAHPVRRCAPPPVNLGCREDRAPLSDPVASTLQLPADDPFVKAGGSATLAFRTAYNLDGTVEITANRSFTKRTETYNFTVEELHTYHVPAGSAPILVHNSCCPTAGASLSNLTGSERARIQNAANRTGQPIPVVGSRSLGPRPETNPDGVGHMSDWDYVITGINSRAKHSVSSSLPKADITVGVGRRQDIFTGPLDTTKPHITFCPQGK